MAEPQTMHIPVEINLGAATVIGPNDAVLIVMSPDTEGTDPEGIERLAAELVRVIGPRFIIMIGDDIVITKVERP